MDYRPVLLRKAAEPNGVARRDFNSFVTGADRPKAREQADQLVAEGALIGVFHPGARSNTGARLFTTQALADAWLAKPYATKPKYVRKLGAAVPADGGLHTPGAEQAAQHWRMRKVQPRTGPPPEPKVTVAPVIRHDPRVQVGPGEKVQGIGLGILPQGYYTEPATSAAARAAAERMGQRV